MLINYMSIYIAITLVVYSSSSGDDGGSGGGVRNVIYARRIAV